MREQFHNNGKKSRRTERFKNPNGYENSISAPKEAEVSTNRKGGLRSDLSILLRHAEGGLVWSVV